MVERKGLKKGIDQEDSRRRREATTVQIRKDKKEDSLQKRRRDVSGGASSSGGGGAQQKDVGALPDPSLKARLESMPEDVLLLQSADPAEQVATHSGSIEHATRHVAHVARDMLRKRSSRRTQRTWRARLPHPRCVRAHTPNRAPRARRSSRRRSGSGSC